jgi:hypothetical protein
MLECTADIRHLLCECEITTDFCDKFKVPTVLEFLRIFLLQLTAKELAAFSHGLLDILDGGITTRKQRVVTTLVRKPRKATTVPPVFLTFDGSF